ncbi:hypothetical protein HN873_000391 [Arachis hypogaea]
MCKVEEMLEEPFQYVPYLPKPIIYSPTRPLLQYSDATHNYIYETNSIIEELNGYIHLSKKGYGILYKVSLNDSHQVAVKVLKESKEYMKEFVNEVVIISRISYVNIVSLFEFCYEMNNKAIIYEFMSNGSLDKFAYKQGSFHLISNLDWDTLYHITISVDFELVKIYKKNKSIVSMLGTRWIPGYITREMFSRMYGGISHKTDV